MITSWSYGVNAYPQWRKGTLYLREEPWWLALCGWFIDSVVGYGCRWLHWIKMPNFLKIIRGGHEYTWRAYYGDLGSIYHVHIFNPLYQWDYGHPRSKLVDIELGYDKVKQLFGEKDAKFFAEQEEGIDNHPDSL
jgi:hypothetical protein